MSSSAARARIYRGKHKIVDMPPKEYHQKKFHTNGVLRSKKTLKLCPRTIF